MNRGRSSDSLDNGDDGIILSSSGSSSPTDFTSDDETGANNLYLMTGQPVNKSRSRNLANHKSQPIKIDKYQVPQNFQGNYPLQSRPLLSSDGQQYLIDNCTDEPSLQASTSYYTGTQGRLAMPISSISSRLPDGVTSPLISDQPFGHRCNNQIESVNPHRSMIRHGRSQGSQAGHSSNIINDENGENISVNLTSSHAREVCYYNHVEPYREPSAVTISGQSRGINTIAVRMCSRLVECRNLIEAIEFVEQNRDVIDNLTSIITREAPAFRNYEISNYQIDYSVKESFNPNFWLDREPIVTTADGNCQYHAVSLGLTGSEAYTPEVRLATAVAVIDNREWFDSMLKLIDRGTVLDLVHTIARSYSWGDETTLKAVAVAINRRIFLYTCNIGKKDYEMVKSLSKEELLDAFKEKKYRGGTGIHTYADPFTHVPANNYIMLFHKSEHFIAVLPTGQQLTMFEPYNPIVPVFT